jgi:hypothetical protein
MLAIRTAVAYTLPSAALAALVAHSKFQGLPGFGQAARGHIALQHHGDPVWFRHLCLRPLPDEQTVALPATGQACPGTAQGVGEDKT